MTITEIVKNRIEFWIQKRKEAKAEEEFLLAKEEEEYYNLILQNITLLKSDFENIKRKL